MVVGGHSLGGALALACAYDVTRAGFYRVELRQPGYYPYFTEVNVPEGGATAVKAELRPLLD